MSAEPDSGADPDDDIISDPAAAVALLHHNTPVALALVGVPSVGAIGWFVRARIEPAEPD
ncbi:MULTISPECIES: hypothetical protein [Acidiphilium]|uniref:hypothetical protein n=1 Tax=Acidiphilium TaxID=522 RepID=UPI000494C671|nr:MULTISPECIES: hypothetical protein [Acidiphilium]